MANKVRLILEVLQCIHYKVWGEITYTFLNGATVEV